VGGGAVPDEEEISFLDPIREPLQKVLGNSRICPPVFRPRPSPLGNKMKLRVHFEIQSSKMRHIA
jgi:hypothetical protein